MFSFQYSYWRVRIYTKDRLKMIDFLKILITDQTLITQINANPLLIWNNKQERLSHFDFETVLSKQTKIYKGVLFCFYDNKVEVLFRPHYYFNDNLHNANDFSVDDCIMIINQLINELNLTAYTNDLKIINIEYGINIISPIDCKELVTFISYHGKNEFRSDAGLAYSKKSYSETKNGTANKYKIIKAYNKGLQFPNYCDINTFRFEVKSKKSSYINSLDVNFINDLLKPNTYKTLANELLKEFKNVLILGNSKEHKTLTKKENNQLNKYLNPNNWYKVKQGHRNNFNQTKKRYFSLLEKTGYNIHTEIENIIKNKLGILEKKCADLPPQQKTQKCAYLPINIKTNCTPLLKHNCIITGLDISMQKEGSFLLSHTGLKYHHTHNRKLFDEVKNKYLTIKWTNADTETQIKEIAHNIRNKVNNTRIKQRKLYTSQQTNLLIYFS